MNGVLKIAFGLDRKNKRKIRSFGTRHCIVESLDIHQEWREDRKPCNEQQVAGNDVTRSFILYTRRELLLGLWVIKKNEMRNECSTHKRRRMQRTF